MVLGNHRSSSNRSINWSGLLEEEKATARTKQIYDKANLRALNHKTFERSSIYTHLQGEVLE